jgi:hypothetical protein
VIRSAALAACVATLAVAPALAVDVTVHGQITRGDLSADFPADGLDLGAVSLDGGGDQQAELVLPMTVSDQRGGGTGWHLTIAADGLHQARGPLAGAATRIAGASASCPGGDVCSLPHDDVPYPLAVPTTPVTFFSSAAGTGMGTTDLAATLVLTVPGNAYAGAFQTTLTLALAAGP